MNRLLAEIWPQPASSEESINPAAVFQTYEEAVSAFQSESPTSFENDVAELAKELFDEDAASRDSIYSRGQAILPAISLAIALVTTIGFGFVAKRSDFATIPALAQFMLQLCYVAGLVYLCKSGLLILRLHGKYITWTLGPDQIIPVGTSHTADEYKKRVTVLRIQNVVENYRVTNRQKEILFAAQKSLRNATLAIAIAGIIPVFVWTFDVLHRQPAPCAVHCPTQSSHTVRPTRQSTHALHRPEEGRTCTNLPSRGVTKSSLSLGRPAL